MSIFSRGSGQRRSAGRAPRRAFALLGVAAMAALLGPSSSAWAHGEDSQQAFERTATIAFYDVKFSKNTVNINDEITVTGNVRVMSAWPSHTIGEPDMGFLSLLAPGPVFYVQERWMSGQFTPQSVKVHKGATYPFKIVAKARIPGRHHVHPSLAMEGSGSLVGRGEWVTINEGGTFTQPIELLSGGTVDVETVGLGRVLFFSIVGFLVGALFLLYWLWNPLLQRAVDLQEGRGAEMITKRDKQVSVGFLLVALLIGAIGYAYAETADPHHIPLQVARIEPVPAAPNPLQSVVDSKVDSATFVQDTGRLRVKITVRNTGATPVQLSSLQFADYQVINQAVRKGPLPENSQAGSFVPAAAVAPGATQQITVEMDGKTMTERNLIPLDEAQARLTGLMFFQDASGQTAVAEVNELTSGVLPQF